MSTRSSVMYIEIPFLRDWAIHVYREGNDFHRLYCDIGPGAYNTFVFRIWPPRWGAWQ